MRELVEDELIVRDEKFFGKKGQREIQKFRDLDKNKKIDSVRSIKGGDVVIGTEAIGDKKIHCVRFINCVFSNMADKGKQEEWTQYRQFVDCKFSHLDMKNKELKRMSMRNCFFRNCQFQEATLESWIVEWAKFEHCNFENAKLQGSDINWAQFSSCDMTFNKDSKYALNSYDHYPSARSSFCDSKFIDCKLNPFTEDLIVGSSIKNSKEEKKEKPVKEKPKTVKKMLVKRRKPKTNSKGMEK